MDDGLAIARRRVRIVNVYGLHMRPSTKFVTIAARFRSVVWVEVQGVKVNGKSILEMTTLAAECGSMIDLEAKGDDAEQAIEALAALVDAGFFMEDEPV